LSTASRELRGRITLGVALAVATVAVFGRAAGFAYTGLDDPIYVSSNQRVLDGLTVRGFLWAFRTFHGANWHPLTWLSLMLDAEIGGASPAIFHATNVVLHALNTLLLFTALDRMTGPAGRSAFVAGLFALHPLHVESVAWVAERKDVLSTFFLLLGILAYARYAERPGAARYLCVAAALACGLLAKPMLVTFPLILLLLDCWPLGRLTRPAVPRLVREKIPFFVLAAASAAVTLVAQSRGGAVQSIEALPLWTRAANAVVSYAVYLLKVVWPTNLAVLYPHPGTSIGVLPVAVSALALAGITWLAVRNVRDRPYLAVGWLWYVVTLVPVIGIVQVGLQARADRYTYVPLIGVFFALAWLVPDLVADRPRVARALPAAAVGALLVLAPITWQQVGHWRSRLALFARVNQAIPDYPLARLTLGNLLFAEGATEEAAEHFRAVLARDPKHAGAHNNLGMCLLRTGSVAEGLAHLDEATRLDPRYAAARENRARALLALGRAEESLRDYAESIRLDPTSATAHAGYAEALVERGDAPAAAAHAREALRISPGYAAAHNVLGVALLLQGAVDDAVEEFRCATDADPAFADALANLAGALLQQGRSGEASDRCEEALRIAPDHVGARTNLGLARMRQGRPDDARREFERALRIRPGDPRVLRHLRDLDKPWTRNPGGG
jgi:tetratricopeptide (TPR) repeat protein